MPDGIPPERFRLPVIGAPARLRWDRLSTLNLDSKVLVMNRENGRWAMLQPSLAPFVGLLPAQRESLPTAIAAKTTRVEEILLSAGLDDPAFVPDGELTTLILKLTNACNYACKYCYDYEPEEKA